MRDVFISEIIKEVLGPKSGSNEKISSNPFIEYVTGVIIPKNCKKTDSPDEEITRESLDGENGEDSSQSEEIIGITNGDLEPGMRSKTFGLSFKLKEETILEICCTWGEYTKEVVIYEGEKGKENRNIWARKPFYKIIKINSNELHKNQVSNWAIKDKNNGSIRLYIRRIAQETGIFLINISLINDYISKCFGDEISQNSIYQPSIRIITHNPDSILNIENKKERVIDHVYQNVPVKARGHFCSAIWSDIEYEKYIDPEVLWPDGKIFPECQKFLSCHIRSEFVPFYSVSAPDLGWPSAIPVSPELRAKELSESWDPDKLKKNLEPLIQYYRNWIDTKILEIPKEKRLDFPNKSIRENQETCLLRLQEGLNRLVSDEKARLAFCFANRTIFLQNNWKKRAVNDKDENFTWYPFQLAFFLINIEALTNEQSSFRSHVDLLWIPTGGGKTETYLAMMAYAIALRRIKAVHYDESKNKTGGGVSVLTRYTLRLLTVQQFRRTLLMITAAEYLRVTQCNGLIGWRPNECTLNFDCLYGSVRFSIGLWVGGALTPNHLRYAPPNEENALTILKNESKIVTGDPAQILKCPVCGTWLAIPHEGLPPGEHTIYSVIYCTYDKEKITHLLQDHQNTKGKISILNVDQANLNSNYYTISYLINSDSRMRSDEINLYGEEISKILGAYIASFNYSRPGYFPIFGIPGQKGGSEKPRDFAIYCPNPLCKLNSEINYFEGEPGQQNSSENLRYPDDLVEKKESFPWSYEKRIPIPAYTVDEQIYSNCPTVVISTADKYARLSFEPRCAALFGNIDHYNVTFGYYRKILYPKDQMGKKTPWKQEYNLGVLPFDPPTFIVQDELHLLEGPLGSLYGLYETTIEGLIRERGGLPKYIASSATINEADSHINSLFRKKLFQFPPYGNDYQDSFFVKIPPFSHGWENENNPGRIYCGVYAPGRGSPIPPIRIWARLLKTGYDLRDNACIRNYWTIVGYFNAIRELGGAVSFYHQDVIEWLSNISNNEVRPVRPDKIVELSSRIDSTEVPLILEELEDGVNRPINDNADSIFTTSMFGTGVDIPHLSLMVVTGQPKTTSQYIQATGRVGRRYGALVITLYKTGNVRDLSHYEMFCSYHSRLNPEVEPTSVSPFSQGCIQRGAGPTMVAFLRNCINGLVPWWDQDGKAVLNNPESGDDFQNFVNNSLENIPDLEDIQNIFVSKFGKWKRDAEKLENINPPENLFFHEYAMFHPPEKNVVLGDPQHEAAGKSCVFPNAPQSLRDIEETTAFRVE